MPQKIQEVHEKRQKNFLEPGIMGKNEPRYSQLQHTYSNKILTTPTKTTRGNIFSVFKNEKYKKNMNLSRKKKRTNFCFLEVRLSIVYYPTCALMYTNVTPTDLGTGHFYLSSPGRGGFMGHEFFLAILLGHENFYGFLLGHEIFLATFFNFSNFS